MRIALFALAPIALGNLCSPSLAHEKLFAAADHPGVGGFRTLAALNDVDGDGVRDFAAGHPTNLPAGTAIFSGRTGARLVPLPESILVADARDHDGDGAHDVLVTSDGYLLEVRSSASGQLLRSFSFASSAFWPGIGDAAGLDDLDGDGVPELAVGLPQVLISSSQSSIGPGQVDVLSGADGTVLFADQGTGLGSGYGGRVAPAGDLDGDGVNDYLAGPVHAFTGAVSVIRGLSGADGSRLVERSVTVMTFGNPQVSLAPLGDVDGDQRDDFLIGLPGENIVHAVSGATGFDLWASARAGLAGWDRYGWAVDTGGDWNGDGTPDVLATSNQSQAYSQVPAVALPGPGLVSILSGVDGRSLSTAVGDSYSATIGTDVASLGDVNGDGWPDFVTPGSGGAVVFSGAPSVRAPQSFCVSNVLARIGHRGRASVSGNRFSLTATNVPPGHTGRFIAGRQSDARGLSVSSSWWPNLPRPVVCVATPTLRVGSPVTADASGNVNLPLDLLSDRSRFEPGTTWSFQLVFRDQPWSDRFYSDALRVTFEP